MRKIGVVTVARSDYGIYRPILTRMRDDPEIEMRLYVSGTHLSILHGNTADLIEKDGYEIAQRIEMLIASDRPEAISKSIGIGILGFAQALAQEKPDILLVLGDRFEMYSAVIAALPFNIPVAHIHGGEVTEGAIDDALRHSITKLSHVHFVSTSEYAKRVMQLGEEPWRIHISGAPALDNLKEISLYSAAELESLFGLNLRHPALLVTYHPVTMEYDRTSAHVENLLWALEKSELPVIFTMPNADASNQIIRQKILTYVKTHPNAQHVENMGVRGYFSLMSIALAMVGNSSSGLIEAPSFFLPVVNIGNRQKGRIRAANVIDVDNDPEQILGAIQRAVSEDFRGQLSSLVNPYGNGNATELILTKLKEIALDQRLIQKHFLDLPIVSNS